MISVAKFSFQTKTSLGDKFEPMIGKKWFY